VRLRLRSSFADVIEERVRGHFEPFFERHPSTREKDRPDFIANDSVQPAEYEPEIERYGGIDRLPIAESQFEASSRAVLAIIEDDNVSYESAIGAAMRMHSIFAHALGLDRSNTIDFFSETARRFLRHPSIGVHDETGETHFLAIFDRVFARNREALIAAQSDLWSGLEEGSDFEEPWAGRWHSDMREIGRRLHAARDRFGPQEIDIFQSYMHMTNNRLGIRNHDEPFVARIIERSMRSALEPACNSAY